MEDKINLTDEGLSKWELKDAPNKFFQENRERYIENLKRRFTNLKLDSLIVLKGGDEYPKYDTDVNYSRFYQESNFFYLSGVREPGMLLAIDMKDSNCTLFYDEPPLKNKIWMKVISIAEMAKKYELDVQPRSSIEEFIQKRDMEAIYVLEGINERSKKPVPCASFNFVGEKEYLNKRVVRDIHIYMILCDTRSVKSETEKSLLKFIGKITNEAHKEIMKQMCPGMWERDYENIFMEYLSQKYYTRHYPCIAAAGVNAAVLHYDNNDMQVKEDDLFLADMGIRFCYYCSDVTITIPINGHFSDKQKMIYDVVLKANRESIKAMKPGVKRKDIDILAKKVILKGLQDIGIIKPGYSVDELFDKEIAGIFMPHGIGHFVGLDVHDVGYNISYKSMELFEEGNFFTVEPGIYFIDALIEKAKNDLEMWNYLDFDLLNTFKNFGGIRIEDDIMITSDGAENYQGDVPRTTEEIEQFMAQHNVYLKRTVEH